MQRGVAPPPPRVTCSDSLLLEVVSVLSAQTLGVLAHIGPLWGQLLDRQLGVLPLLATGLVLREGGGEGGRGEGK